MPHYAVRLRHLIQLDAYPYGNIQIPGLAKTLEEIQGWYNSFKVPPYQEMGPDINTGNTKVFTKYFKAGSPLEWFHPADSMELNAENAETGFYSVETYEELIIRLEKEIVEQINSIHMQARDRADMYRNNIEPKMISYDTSTKQSIQ